MSNRKVVYTTEAKKDLRRLDGSQKAVVGKAIDKVSANPLPATEGGYGKPLGNKGGKNLAGYFKIKLKNHGLRIVYRLERRNDEMVIIVIAARADEEVYEIAAKRSLRKV